MNSILQDSINKKKAIPIFSAFIAIFSLLPVLIDIVCVSPIFQNVQSNILYRGSAIALTLQYISDLLDVISFASVYALIIFSFVLLERKSTVFSIIIYVIILLIRFPLKLVMNIPVFGSIGTESEIIFGLINFFLSFSIELIQLLIVTIIASVTAKSYLRSIALVDTKKNSLKGKKIEHILPIKKFINWYNPLLRSAIYMAITVLVLRASSRIIADIEIGLPASFGEVLEIILGYFTDFVYAIVAYIVTIFIFNLLYDSFTKKRKEAKENNSSASLNNEDLSE